MTNTGWKSVVRKPIYSSCVIGETSSTCDKRFEKYSLMKELAENVGTFGVIYLVYNSKKKHNTVLKAIQYVEGVTEVEIYIICALTNAQIPGFIGYVSHIICDEVPSDWLIGRVDEFNAPIVYIEMDEAEGSMYDLLFVVKPKMKVIDMKSIIFEIIYSMHQARITVGLAHRDLKYDNMLYISAPPRTYTLRNSVKIKASSPYRPLIIDFGRSRIEIGNESDPRFDLPNDEDYLFDQLALMKIIKDIGLLNNITADIVDKFNTKEIIDLDDILELPFFDELREK